MQEKKKIVPDFRHGENVHCDGEISPHLNYISLPIAIYCKKEKPRQINDKGFFRSNFLSSVICNYFQEPTKIITCICLGRPWRCKH